MQTLTTGKIIGIVVGLLVVVGGGYALMGKSTPEDAQVAVKDSTESHPVVTEKEKAPTSAVKSSLKDLLGKAGAQKCTFTESNALSRTTIVYYFANGKMRGENESTSLSGPSVGTSIKSSVIIDGDIVYTWDDVTKQGVKMSKAGMGENTLTPLPGTKTTNTPQQNLAEQFEQGLGYNCEPWKADTSLFVPPKTITFMDMNEMMKGLPNMGNMKMPTAQ